MYKRQGEETWEEAESTMQKEALQTAIGKAQLMTQQVRYLFGGDLLAQLIATSFGNGDAQIPLFGLYGACSTCGEMCIRDRSGTALCRVGGQRHGSYLRCDRSCRVCKKRRLPAIRRQI